MKVVSFYTDDYEEDVKRLICSLKKFNLDYDIENIESLGSWDLNTNYKATFIKKKLLKHKQPIVWLDADSEVVKYPKYFDVIEEDIGVCYENLSKLKSGTIYFNHTDKALKILNRWEINSKNTNITDQMHLQQVLRGEYIESHNVTLFCLPSSYYCIYDIMKDWTEPVIKQYQASRRHRASRRHLR